MRDPFRADRAARSGHPAAGRAALALAALVLALGLASPGSAAPRDGSDPVDVVALAVAEDASGSFVGVSATVTAQVLAGGSGQVFVATKPLAQTDMQGSARVAVRVAAATLGADWEDYDYLVSFRSESTVIGGPSAGAVMALALTTALHNLLEPDDPWTLDPGVAATGTINADGTIGPVGGIPAKAEGAKEAGLTHFLYPAGLDIAATQVNGQVVAVDMQSHCAALALECTPAAHLVDVLAAAGIDVDLPPAPVPGTTDYREDLEPGVREQVADLEARLARARDDPRLGASAINPSERAEILAERATAEERLREASAALDGGRFYLAATRSFQGHIQAGRVENLTSFHAAPNTAERERIVVAALEGCQAAAAEAAAATDGLRAEGITALYAVGSAQQRAAQAAELRDQAQALYSDAVTFDDWVQSTFASTFCVERAGTAAWWADLRTPFGAGPGFGDREALTDDVLEAAREEVAYAAAVLGGEALREATRRLQQAEAHADAGRQDAAVLEAIEAQTTASVAMQTAGGGASVPSAVLEAAVQSASRAIDTARGQGVEPMLSVSLVELAQDQNETTLALANLWSARSLALLDRAPDAAEFGEDPDGEGDGDGSGGDGDGGRGGGDGGGMDFGVLLNPFSLVFGVGMAVGALVVGLTLAGVWLSRR